EEICHENERISKGWRLGKPYCLKQNVENPNCGICMVFTGDDIKESVIQDIKGSGGQFSSLCFRIFHKDLTKREMWRQKCCKHYTYK
ncbi:MAG: hypothetical protein ABIH42_00620, partial [Planctomycetota bacterium]